VVSPPHPSTAHLLDRVAVLAARARAVVDLHRQGTPGGLDRFKGIYLPSDDLPDLAARRPLTLLPDDRDGVDEIEARADTAEQEGATIRLRKLVRSFDLPPVAVDMLLAVVAPDLDRRFEPYYGFLHDDVTRRRASVGLVLELARCSTVDPQARALLRPGGVLVDSGLVRVDDADRPFLTRSLRAPDRVTQHLLGSDLAEEPVRRLAPADHPWVVGDAEALADSLARRGRLAYLREPMQAGTARGLAGEAFRRLGTSALHVDLERLDPGPDLDPVFKALLLEARLSGRGLVVGPVESLVEQPGGRDRPELVRKLTALHWPLVVIGHRTWDPAWSTDVPVVVDVHAAGPAERSLLWKAVLDGECPPEVDPFTATAPFKMGPDQIARAASSAWLQAGLADRPISAADLRSGSRSQNAAGLERLAHRIEPSAGWNDLVLPPDARQLLGEAVSRARWRERVLDDWGMRQTGRRGDGISALFAGPPGTGKTTAAEVIATELGFDLYTVDLATVVDKYIGETEKNLERIFDQAEKVNGILFFDEADALFGKRSDVKDARDRYANVEVAYLLQRMEAFDGVAILATNLRANLDEAFTRRLDAVIDFPMPDVDQRLALWQRCLGTGVPVEPDLDLDFCARSFELSGGDIRNIALAAAFMAASEGGRTVTMADVIRSIGREYRKLGRLCVEAEFGPYYQQMTAERY